MDPDPGGLKTCGSGFGSGSLTLLQTLLDKRKKDYSIPNAAAQGIRKFIKWFVGRHDLPD
jgi:hypothetical protein